MKRKSQGKTILEADDLSHVPAVDFRFCISIMPLGFGEVPNHLQNPKMPLLSTDLYGLVPRNSYDSSRWLMKCDNPKAHQRTFMPYISQPAEVLKTAQLSATAPSLKDASKNMVVTTS